ncbi:efflux RND transporter periplasmic adaptor subunit [Nisaea acidiphila]|uniref:Efflux RND transporter periplasmic adaptor subunit n=1 Tax=Nisaea acidiphila TaxID=1862145 RepID=A0A9J7ATV2_9PROT|nr:efflux RND transporter periplasmic adaptor subunit [Nisaea acidiphila]UUX50743.1 efflux RND transporter periplasmic adaptor subunit [Nisaea acidiphila]
MSAVLMSLRCNIVPALLLAMIAAGSPANAQSKASPVEADEVREEPLTQTAPATGRFVAIELGSVATRVSERVEAVTVRAGDRVEKGDILARLSDRRLRAERSLRAAALKKADAQLERALANRAKAEQALARTEQLRGSNAFRKNALEDAQRDLEAASASFAEGEAETARARAELDLAEIALSDAAIRAPYSGVILARHVVAGDHVQIGEAIVTMMNDEALEIEADVPANRLAGLAQGVLVEAELQNGQRIEAAVRAIIPEENPRTRTRAVRFTTDLPDDAVHIAENQGVTVFIPVGTVRQVISVHKDALLLDRAKPRVYVVRDGKVEPRTIVIGESLGNRFEVIEGLAAGDMVVIKGNERLRPGQPVAVQVKG